jgi:hypothetical protein
VSRSHDHPVVSRCVAVSRPRHAPRPKVSSARCPRPAAGTLPRRRRPAFPTTCCATTPATGREHTLPADSCAMPMHAHSKTKRSKAAGKARGKGVMWILQSCHPCPLAKRLTMTAPSQLATNSQTRPTLSPSPHPRSFPRQPPAAHVLTNDGPWTMDDRTDCRPHVPIASYG